MATKKNEVTKLRDAAVERWKRYCKGLTESDAGAQYNIGVTYEQGRGVMKSYTEAMRWNRMAADQGYADAQAKLGLMYEDDRGVTQDHTEALR